MKFKEIIDNLNGNARRRANARIAVGTSIGVLAGATAGILLAPKSGKQTRKAMKHGADLGVEKTRKAARKAADFVKDEAALVNKTITEKMNDLKTHLKRKNEVKS